MDIEFVAGRKQLRKHAVPHYFCTCPYNKEAHRRKKQLEVTDHMYSSNRVKKFLPLQVRASNALPNDTNVDYVSEHNYFAHSGKKNENYFVQTMPSDSRKNMLLLLLIHNFIRNK